MRRTTKIVVSVFIIVVVLLSLYQGYNSFSSHRGFTLTGENVRIPQSKPLLVSIDTPNQIQSAICFSTVANGKKYYLPLFYRLNEDPSYILNKYSPDEIKISTFGDNPSKISIEIAKRYWEKIDIAVIVSDYEGAILCSPIAGYLNAPIIFSGTDDVEKFLVNNNVKNVIVYGGEQYKNIGVMNLKSKLDIWNFYLSLLSENNENCDYIVVTNPGDINDDMLIPYLSLISSVLAINRNAVIITGNYSVKWSWISSIGYGTGDAGSGERGSDTDTLTDNDEIEIQKKINAKAIQIDNDIDQMVSLMKDYNMSVKYLALVGGPVSLPMLYIKNPIWYDDANNGAENDGEEYLATDSYYGDTDIILDLNKNVEGEYICYNPQKDNAVGEYNGSNYESEDDNLYTQELAVGRIVARNILDASALLVRSILHRRDVGCSAEGRYYSILTSRVCGTASQSAATIQANVFTEHGVRTTKLVQPPIPSTTRVYLPEEISSTHTAGNPARMSYANYIIYDGHGYPDGWYYWWVHAHDYDNSPDTIRTEDVEKLELPSSVVFSASCLNSALDWPTIWNGSTDERAGNTNTFFSLGLLHAGAIAHIGSTEESWGVFFGGTVNNRTYGDFDMATFYFEHLLEGKTLGEAHIYAKRDFVLKEGMDAFTRTCYLENVLYGEPKVIV